MKPILLLFCLGLFYIFVLGFVFLKGMYVIKKPKKHKVK